jgi:hypothetical protein
VFVIPALAALAASARYLGSRRMLGVW